MAFRKISGGASSSGVTTATMTSASATCHLYGFMYCRSRRIKRESYALPRASSSCRLLMRVRALLSATVSDTNPRSSRPSQQSGVCCALGDGAFYHDNDLVGVANGRGALRYENRGTAF